MENSELEGYERCKNMIHELIAQWERIRPEEELVVIVLPKYDQMEREKRLRLISEALLKERWKEQ